ncbi:hypothetical protein KAFR_0C04310 [Kazachstania africana CBS 2517]|uniref:Uncharacterized protein n=1 Tax=Kazachstania africana (strain ATCC 22294 / BCRC 22015 / CBS 2517 / CECT 1963 / NBRC 1671 / NRRL Y-8276) TaxID=1071382 RepID=H2ASS1_KAZAF|nr:hypothetical protein KAFR_0C04310 [Kazachstania africana CBS 2517]CCF57421.1 hypothetical protein KAFR_0C04310 [Kazachstania africana CBS 2517]
MEEPVVKVCNLKLVLLGESSVGKSSIVTRFVTGKFQKNNATIGAAFTSKSIKLDDYKEVNLEIWDTAGQERYRSLAPMYYRETDVALVVFDVTNKRSLERAQSWIDELNFYIVSERQHAVKIMLVANKADLITGMDIDTNVDLSFTKVSAKTGEGIQELFDQILSQIPEDSFRSPDHDNKNVISINKDNATSNVSYCTC